MIYRSTDEIIAQYEQSETINQSRLKLLLKGVESFNSAQTPEEVEDALYKEKEAGHFIIGHTAERLALYGSEVFDKEYYMSDVEKPSDKVMSIIKQCYDIQMAQWGEVPKLSTITTDLLDCIIGHSYYPKWGDKAKIDNVIKAGENYYNDLISSQGKQILSLEQYDISRTISDSWTTHERTRHFFTEYDGIDFHYQFPVFFQLFGVDCKGLIDILEVNHIEKFIRVVDAKTMGNFTINFPSALRERRYDFQVCFYYHGAMQLIETRSELKGYTLRPPQFITETTKPGKQGNPLVFTMTPQLMDIAMNGRTFMAMTDHYPTDSPTKIQNEIPYKEIRGIYYALELYKFHLKNGFNADRRVMQAAGKPLEVRWEGII